MVWISVLQYDTPYHQFKKQKQENRKLYRVGTNYKSKRMIWKIETIEDNKGRIPFSIIENIRAMIASLEPNKRVSQEKLYQISKLVDTTDLLRRQGLHRKARYKLREAYKILDEMNCKRYSGASRFENMTEKRKSWAENHLKEFYREILRKL